MFWNRRVPPRFMPAFLAAAMVPMILLSPLGEYWQTGKTAEILWWLWTACQGFLCWQFFSCFKTAADCSDRNTLVLLSVLEPLNRRQSRHVFPKCSRRQYFKGKCCREPGVRWRPCYSLSWQPFYTAVGIRLVLFTTALCFL